MPEGTQIFLFVDSVKPLWEDSGNKNGGRFMFRVKKNFGNRIWEELLLSFIGE
jgi:translation initiation factor 4E